MKFTIIVKIYRAMHQILTKSKFIHFLLKKCQYLIIYPTHFWQFCILYFTSFCYINCLKNGWTKEMIVSIIVDVPLFNTLPYIYINEWLLCRLLANFKIFLAHKHETRVKEWPNLLEISSFFLIMLFWLIWVLTVMYKKA